MTKPATGITSSCPFIKANDHFLDKANNTPRLSFQSLRHCGHPLDKFLASITSYPITLPSLHDQFS